MVGMAAYQFTYNCTYINDFGYSSCLDTCSYSCQLTDGWFECQTPPPDRSSNGAAIGLCIVLPILIVIVIVVVITIVCCRRRAMKVRSLKAQQ